MDPFTKAAAAVAVLCGCAAILPVVIPALFQAVREHRAAKQRERLRYWYPKS